MLTEVKKCPGYCTFSSVWIIAINIFFFIFGLVFIGASAWGIGQQKEDPVTQALPAGGLVTLVVVGVFLVILAVVGCAGVKFNDKIGGRYVLGIYATVLVILMIMEFAAAGALLTFTGKLDDWNAAGAVKDYGITYLINQSYVDCCCNRVPCPNDTCWLPANLLYPCDSLDRFKEFLKDYITARIEPIGVIAILIGLVQFFTAIVACCSQCKGQRVEEQKKIGGPLSYDGLYAEGEEAYSGYGYESYVKSGQARPAAGAGGKDGGAAPKAGGAGAGAGRPPAGGGARPPPGGGAPAKK